MQKIKNIYHLINAIIANLWFGFPSRKLTVVGVTGTDGKTTTVSLIYHILHTAGYNASMISSVGAIIGGKNYDVGFHVTTPSPWGLQRFIKKAVDSEALRSLRQFKNFSNASVPVARYRSPRDTVAFGDSSEKFFHAKAPRASYLVLETTSHALDQHRVFGIKFDVGVLTNITHEHLDYHKTYENYVNTKAKLLKMARVAVVNREDKSYDLIENIKNKIEKIHRKNKKWITYGLRESADINPKIFSFKTNLIGEFNRFNVLAATATCKALEVTDSNIRKGIESFKAPTGREEIVYKNSFTVMIDFAHTPNAFEQILRAVKNPPSSRSAGLRRTKGRLIHVFGSAGQRDATKRPLMGKVSAKYADIIVLTAEDPRSESVEKIIKEIEGGVTNSKFEIRNSKQFSKSEFSNVQNKNKYVFEIPNRQDAINAAVKIAKKGDFVLITGKSHEKSMNYGRGEVPWDEFGAVKKALFERNNEQKSK